MKEECLICGAPLEYLETDVQMQCEICRKKELAKTRCCKRDSFLSILTAIDFVKEHFGIALQKPEVVCRYAAQNNQCIGKRCPFSAANH